MSIGKKLLSLRQQKGISQQELADYLHVTRQTVSKWESDLSLPDMKMSLDIAQFYDITITELLGIEEEVDENSLKQLYEKTNVVLDNMQREFKRNRIFDFGIIGVCILSLAVSLVLLVKSNNQNEQIINNNYYENTNTDLNTVQKNVPSVTVENYYLDTMSADIYVKFIENNISSNAKAYIYLKDSNDLGQQLPMTLTASNAFEYKGNLKLDYFEESVILLEDEGKKSRYEWNINEHVLSYSDLLRSSFTLSIPYSSGVYDTDVVKYKMVKSVNGVRIRGALDASVRIRVNSELGDTLFYQTIDSHYNKEFQLPREIKVSEKLVSEVHILKDGLESVATEIHVTFEYPKVKIDDFYIINLTRDDFPGH